MNQEIDDYTSSGDNENEYDKKYINDKDENEIFDNARKNINKGIIDKNNFSYDNLDATEKQLLNKDW